MVGERERGDRLKLYDGPLGVRRRMSAGGGTIQATCRSSAGVHSIAGDGGCGAARLRSGGAVPVLALRLGGLGGVAGDDGGTTWRLPPRRPAGAGALEAAARGRRCDCASLSRCRAPPAGVVGTGRWEGERHGLHVRPFQPTCRAIALPDEPHDSAEQARQEGKVGRTLMAGQELTGVKLLVPCSLAAVALQQHVRSQGTTNAWNCVAPSLMGMHQSEQKRISSACDTATAKPLRSVFTDACSVQKSGDVHDTHHSSYAKRLSVIEDITDKNRLAFEGEFGTGHSRTGSLRASHTAVCT